MPTYVRTRLPLFELANPAYAGATVSLWLVDSSNVRTTTLADVYDSVSGSTKLTNPMTLDTEGKMAVPAYIEDPVEAEVTNASVPDAFTGLLFPAQLSETNDRSYAGDPNSNVAGLYVGQNLWDSTNNRQYVCTTAGDAGTAVWRQVAGDWQAPFRMNTSFLWVDSTGDLRINGTAPSSDTDGTVVGTQS